jgi:hypothetical protein
MHSLFVTKTEMFNLPNTSSKSVSRSLFNEPIFIFLELCYADESQSKFIVVLIV